MSETDAFPDYDLQAAKQSLPFTNEEVFTLDELATAISPSCPQFSQLHAQVEVSTSFKQIFTTKVTIEYSGTGHKKLKDLIVPVYFTLLISEFSDESVWKLAQPEDFIISCRFGNVIGPIADAEKCDAVDIRMTTEGIFLHFLDGILCGGCNLLGTEANILFDFRHKDCASLDPSIPEGELICTDSDNSPTASPTGDRAAFLSVMPVMEDGSVRVLINSTVFVSGLQFSLVNHDSAPVDIFDVDSEFQNKHAFTVDFEDNTILAFSMDGGHLPVFEEISITLVLDAALMNQQLCITHAVVADNTGSQVLLTKTTPIRTVFDLLSTEHMSFNDILLGNGYL